MRERERECVCVCVFLSVCLSVCRSVGLCVCVDDDDAFKTIALVYLQFPQCSLVCDLGIRTDIANTGSAPAVHAAHEVRTLHYSTAKENQNKTNMF